MEHTEKPNKTTSFEDASIAEISEICCRKISEFGGIHIEMAKVMVGELLDSELRQSEFGRFLDALLGRHIHKVQRRLTTAGMVLG